MKIEIPKFLSKKELHSFLENIIANDYPELPLELTVRQIMDDTYKAGYEMNHSTNNNKNRTKRSTGQPNIYGNGHSFLVKFMKHGKVTSLGSYPTIEEAIVVRDNYKKENNL